MLSRFAVESLESRLLYAMTPADPRPNTLGKSFDITERQDLLARLSNLPSSTYTTLNNALKASNIATFDNSLLGYMRSRSSAKYFFQPGSADSIADYVNNNLSSTSQIQRADRVTDQRLFPAQSSVEDYTVQLPANINWADASPSSNPEFINALNRQEWWVDLAQGYQYSGNNKYVNELKYELADWAYENPTFTMPSVAKKRQSYGFDMSIRMDNQLMAYFSILGSGAWDGASNSLMLYKLIQQGDVVGVIGNGLKDNSSNRSIAIGRSTMYMGVVLPEVDSAAAWEADGRAVLYRSIDGQFYSDGTHREQSPGYAVLTIDDLLDARRLDVLNNNPWDAGKLATLENAVD
ncbi:MAG TPA: heparinase II/III family protein, partial [Tepidisphaeraceae bacterium]